MEPLRPLSLCKLGQARRFHRACFKVLHFVYLMLAGSMMVPADELKPISLPPPNLQSGMLLMDALLKRKTSRDFAPAPLPLPVLGDALWAAYGINRPADGRRTAPSAMNSQEIDLFVALPEGLYRYDAPGHQLVPVSGEDVRAKAGQPFSSRAPVVLIFVADLSRLDRARETERRFYAAFDAGAISQNLYLFCASTGLGTVVHDLDRGPLSQALKLRQGQEIILAQAVGYPAPDAPAHSSWAPLFNGRDLSGWVIRCRPKDEGKIFWRVEDGTIACDSSGRRDHDYVWLMTEREFGDFELRLQFQAFRNSPGNSGLQFRSRYDPATDGGWLDGPQVDIHPPSNMSWRTGLIYDETREERRWVFPSLKNWEIPVSYRPPVHVFRYADEGSGWNDLVLTCRGMRVTSVVNGVTRTDWDATGVLDSPAHERRGVGRRGHFALQLHSGDELRIRFREIQVRDF